jgi:chromosome segregation ATPase
MEEKLVKHFTEEEVNEIQQLQQKILITVSRIGEVELNIQELENAFQELKGEKVTLINSYNDVKVQELELGKRLREKYGDGQYDISTNTFTPNK